MKKFIAGLIAGAIIFWGVPAFANSIQSILGSKVTRVYTVKNSNGQKIADGAILNGSTYVPVRAISEVTGTPLTVDSKGKVIILGEKTTVAEVLPDSLKEKLKGDLKEAEDRLNILNDKLSDARSADDTAENKEYIESLTEKIAETNSMITDIKTKIGE